MEFLTRKILSGARRFMPLSKPWSGRVNRPGSPRPMLSLWAFRKGKKIIRVNPIALRLEVFFPSGTPCDYHLCGSATAIGPKAPLAVFHPSDSGVLRESPPRTIAIDAANVLYSFVSILAVALIYAFYFNANSHGICPKVMRAWG
ncbi:hypothetical protein M2323_000006 [Rhodoblastus acidophilus]|nr:hypothetical protein [Rhodoblastus acidophilus]MCW2331108.1 hypothetical protein [Rhodoblastus acidophilus]